jgi:hypothetical protein
LPNIPAIWCLSLLLPAVAAALSAPIQLRPGDMIAVRLTSEVCSFRSKPGDAVNAAVLSVLNRRGGRRSLLRDVWIEGELTQVRRVGYGLRNSRAAISLQFDRLYIGSGQAQPVTARLIEVDNARETVDPRGSIRGIFAGDSPGNRITSRLIRLPAVNPYPDFPLLAYKLATPFFPEPEIHFDPGTEMWLELDQETSIPGVHAVSGEHFTTEEIESLTALAKGLPVRTVEGKKQRDADIVNLLIVGSRNQVEDAFLGAGWLPADKVTARSIARSIFAQVEERSYPAAPMSGQTLDGIPQDMSWQQTLNSKRHRHHARLWKLADGWNGVDAWAGAATHDIGVKLSMKRMSFIHRIDPNIDLEREKIINDLFAAGCLAGWTYAGRSGVPKSSLNATGDVMQTDQKLAVLRLRDCRDPEFPAAGGRAKVKHGSPFRRWARKQILTLRYDLVHANIFGGAYQAIRAVHHTLSSGPPQASASRAVDGYAQAIGED